VPEGLVVEGLVKEYSGDGYVVRVLDGRAFHAQADELVALVGPSGSGKSTLLSYLDDMLSPTSGSIYLDVTGTSGTSGTSGSSCRASISFHHSMHARTSLFR
jgi:ABC-type lipoprotein export system ATPase subunit